MLFSWEPQSDADRFTLYARPYITAPYKAISTTRRNEVTVKLDGRRNWWVMVRAKFKNMSSQPSNVVHIPRGY